MEKPALAVKDKAALRVACIVMQRNEDLCLNPWLAWHGHLFGLENLYIIDHGSDYLSVQQTLSSFEAQGGHVLRLPATADYRQKGSFVSFALDQVDKMGIHNILFPLDCDEFIVIRDENNQLTCAKEPILKYLSGLCEEKEPLLVQENLANAVKNPQGFWALPYQKIFFTSGHSGAVDHGSHCCVSRNNTPVPTRVVYAHLHYKAYKTQLKMSREKLRPFVNVDDMEAVKAFRGTGWHLVEGLLKTEEEYMHMMAGGSVQFPEFPAMLQKLGIDPRFCDN